MYANFFQTLTTYHKCSAALSSNRSIYKQMQLCRLNYGPGSQFQISDAFNKEMSLELAKTSSLIIRYVSLPGR